jgi:hypothetical protein
MYLPYVPINIIKLIIYTNFRQPVKGWGDQPDRTALISSVRTKGFIVGFGGLGEGVKK